jgi:hypothetical protein
MNLARHAAVLWRFRAVTLTGLVVGAVLAVMASYQPTLDGGPKLTPRGTETWAAVSQILVTQPGFPEGRVTLPETQVGDAKLPDGSAASEDGAPPADQVEFADPGRLSALADLYSRFLTSDDVLRLVPGRPTAANVEASPYAASQGGLLLPVIQLTTRSVSATAAQQLNIDTFNGLRAHLRDEQRANSIARGRRVQLKILSTPKPALVSGRKPTASILVILLTIVGTLAVTHLLAAVRDRGGREPELGIVDWDAVDYGPDPAVPRLGAAGDPSPGHGEPDPVGAAAGRGLLGGRLRR